MFRPAERRKAKLRLGLTGPAGSGKTASALLIAYGITEDWGKIGLVDTESGSGELYANSNIGGTEIGQYNVLTIKPPFEPQKYISAIKAAEKAGLEVVILDSISHAWSGEGGLLDTQGKVASKTGNSYTAWRQVTPLHNEFIDAMLQSSIHVIATMRSKQEYVIEQNDRGKSVPKKVGMAPVQRDGMDYEFTVVFDLSQEHVASVSKDRTSLFDGKFFIPTPETGREVKAWLETGSETPIEEAKSPKPTQAKTETKETPPVEKATKEPQKETSQKEEPIYEAVIMGEVSSDDKNLSVKAVLINDEGGEVKLIAPVKYKALIKDGAALKIKGELIGGELIATQIFPITEQEERAIITLLSEPKEGTFVNDGEKITSNWAYAQYGGDDKNTFVIADMLGIFDKGEVLDVSIMQKITKGEKTMLFIKDITRKEQVS